MVYRIRVNKLDCSFFCNNTFFFHFNSNSNSCCCSSFTVTSLQNPQFTFFNCKFHILNIFVTKFQFFSDVYILFIQSWHFSFKFSDRFWSSDTCNNVFTLSVSQVFTVEFVFTSSWVTCERYACSTIFTHITEYHCLNVNSCTEIVSDFVHVSVSNCTRNVPRSKYSFNSFLKLYVWVLREFFSCNFFDNIFVDRNQRFPTFSRNFCIFFNAFAFFNFFYFRFKIFLSVHIPSY